MRKFDIQYDQSIRKERGVRKTNFSADIPQYMGLSPKVSIGAVREPSMNKQRAEWFIGSMFDQTLERTKLQQSLGCKEVRDLLRNEYDVQGILNNMHYTCKPHWGAQRGDPWGLGRDPVYPTNNPLLKKSDNFFAYLKTPLKGIH